MAYSKSAFSLIDLPETELQRKDFAEYFSGNKLLPGSKTAAHCYCGHQFGHFSGQLGDGAAMLVYKMRIHKFLINLINFIKSKILYKVVMSKYTLRNLSKKW